MRWRKEFAEGSHTTVVVNLLWDSTLNGVDKDVQLHWILRNSNLKWSVVDTGIKCLRVLLIS